MKKLNLALCILFSSTVVHASEQAAAPKGGDIEAGKAKAAVCAACHGTDGNSTVPTFPKIAGQGEAYIAGQLHAFKSGMRKEPSMSPQAANLSEEDMKDLAAYFSAQETKPGVADKEQVALGEKLYRGGSKAKDIMACTACHGPTGAGNPSASYPQLSGQHPEYVLAQLKKFSTGERSGTAAATVMGKIAVRMSDAEMKAVAQYVAGLR